MVDLAAMVTSTLESERRSFNAVLMLANSVRKVKTVAEILPKDLKLNVLSSQTRVVEALHDAEIDASLLEESLTSQGLGVLNHVHDLVLQAIGEGNLTSGERLLVVLAEPLDGVIVVDTSNLNSNRFAALAQDYSIDLEILTKMMQLARQIGSRGREGHAVGALFALGALPALRKHTTALVLNPFKGHAAEKRSILDEANHETLAEFAWLDGAILFNREGIASDAGRYIQVPAGITPKPGEGGRHLAARAISQLVDGIAVCVSSSGTITVYANGRNRYRVKLN
ncbi:MAG: diadenylate cyclase [Candidatus Poseidoniaceae archaeon]|nr:diadenylate cyclase [Candidatus Poseidoniaceae archaeon]